jgi:hypothetical protein
MARASRATFDIGKDRDINTCRYRYMAVFEQRRSAPVFPRDF